MLILLLVNKVRNEKLLKRLGLNLRTIRTKAKLSQQQLANNAEIELSQVSRIELGKIDPSVSTLFAIATALDIELKELMDFN